MLFREVPLSSTAHGGTTVDRMTRPHPPSAFPRLVGILVVFPLVYYRKVVCLSLYCVYAYRLTYLYDGVKNKASYDITNCKCNSECGNALSADEQTRHPALVT
jgi:hypothetical protein